MKNTGTVLFAAVDGEGDRGCCANVVTVVTSATITADGTRQTRHCIGASTKQLQKSNWASTLANRAGAMIVGTRHPVAVAFTYVAFSPATALLFNRLYRFKL